MATHRSRQPCPPGQRPQPDLHRAPPDRVAHRVIDILNAVLASACLGILLPNTVVGNIAQAVGMVVVMYPALEPIFAAGVYWQRFAPGMVGIVAVLELAHVQMPAAVTVVILAAAVVGWLITSRRQAAR